jgi:hypothetical protein
MNNKTNQSIQFDKDKWDYLYSIYGKNLRERIKNLVYDGFKKDLEKLENNINYHENK